MYLNYFKINDIRSAAFPSIQKKKIRECNYDNSMYHYLRDSLNQLIATRQL